MSYSIKINFEVSGVVTPLLPEHYILGSATNPTTIEEGESVTLNFKADGMYFTLKKRNGASATGAALSWDYVSATEANIILSDATSNVEVTVIASVKAAPQVVSKPFLYRMAAPVDTRLVLSKKEMKTANDEYLPDVYFALCTDDGHFYLYNKASEISEDTGKFSLITDMVETTITSFDGGEIV